ncbi:AAA domain-containing protein [Actinomycetospora cinnamomea]|uniref:AAA domain-containing protein n=2 Tax=Actinomycetospora cinnamomea TaxID=663609 RepID=A0A2U1FD90_9PSEU|nr:AAA domain-containing protein [Actinomycetospora cinnamomea]
MRYQLDNPLPENGFVVKELAGTGMTILFIAQWKAGKTTAGFNLAVALADGGEFLGRFGTELREDTSVAYWNFELDGRRAQDWVRDLDPQHPERLYVEHWRGYGIPIETPAGEDFAVGHLIEQAASVLIIDPSSSAHDHDENSAQEMGRWYKAVERIKRRAGLDLVVIVAHAGHGGVGENGDGLPRVRGNSKQMGDADAFWFYQHGGEHGQIAPDSRRYFTAYGRDIDTGQITLDYDSTSRRLEVVSGVTGRAEDRALNTGKEVWRILDNYYSSNTKTFAGKSKLEKLIRTAGKSDYKREGIEYADRMGWIEIEEQGDGRPILYRLGKTQPEDDKCIRLPPLK